MKASIDLTPMQRHTVVEILKAHLPSQSTVWIFGSRAKGEARKNSDLDLVIEFNHSPLSLQIMVVLKEAFDESLLPFKVDIIDWFDISESFRQHIENDRVLLLKIA